MSFIIMTSLVLANYINYAEVIKERIYITSIPPISDVVSPVDGKIIRLFFKNHDHVKKNEIILIFENSANPESMLELIKMLDTFKSKVNIKEFYHKFPHYNDLGIIQKSYSNYLKSIEVNNKIEINLDFELESKQIKQKLSILHTQLDNYNLYTEYLQEILSRYTKNISLDSIEFDKKKYHNFNNYMNKKELNDVKSKVINNSINILNCKKEMLEQTNQLIILDKKLKKRKHALQREIDIKFNILIEDLKVWFDKFVIKSYTAGKIQFNENMLINSYIYKGNCIARIVPDSITSLYGRIEIDNLNVDRIAIGQRTIIKLDRYNSQNFWTLEGYISRISSVTFDKKYILKISIPDWLYIRKDIGEIPLNNEYFGTAEIIVESSSILKKIFSKFNSIEN
ncbi:MAG: HlyD family efflux transporter periplasmic adaptor subunit [Ignavibacteriales bacterium]|nr:HlyD family efflux transporter periplasmic adaptor subunit [Ignavibacteriota bacterium]MCB9250770.1 HlyD family efflux transporter periplasmic adaptor subunit [Ignavibacteriales bacterium]